MPPSPPPPRERGAGRSPDGPAPPPLRVRTGMDLAEVSRVEELMTSQPELRERVFTARELAYCYRRKRSGEHLAGRWAAKEAVLKSLGTGMGPRMEWTDIEVVNDRAGRPRVRLYGEVETVARSLGMHSIDLSLSHSGGLAVAHAVMVCQPTAPHTAPAHTTHTAEGDERHEA
ncbi:holo-ACP synthase [Streptomyces sp. NPDC057543]|uniref:holo-ACP synthase n=1 Tax=Streptomyces sp. NPDC057543 TaxID=3346163 RepID=UPI0036AE511C